MGKKKKFAWHLLFCYSSDSSMYHTRNDVTEMILLDREPTAKDLKRFNPKLTFRKCSHSRSKPPGRFEYCGWSKLDIKQKLDKRNHSSSTPSYRAEVNKHDLSELEKRIMDLEGQNFVVWRGRIPVPVYASLNEYFSKRGDY